MRPILLKGHERAVTAVAYNREGDLLFSGGKDSLATAWYSSGERLGTYDGHKGAVTSLDVSDDSSLLLTGGADSTTRLWEVRTGRELFTWQSDVSVRSVDFAHGESMFVNVSDNIMGRKALLSLYKLPSSNPEDLVAAGPSIARPHHVIELEGRGQKVTQARFGPLNESIIGVDGSGNLLRWDTETGTLLETKAVHDRTIYSFNFDPDHATIVTASDDTTAKLFDLRSLELLKTYQSNVPIRAAAVSPLMDHVILAGGQAAKDVTVTRMDNTQFSVRFYHKIFEEEIGTVKGHFGPVHGLAWAPDGKSFASVSEDGFIRLHNMDPDYFTQFSPEAEAAKLMQDAAEARTAATDSKKDAA